MKRQNTDHPDMKIALTKKGDMDNAHTPHAHTRLEMDGVDGRVIVRDHNQTDVPVLWNNEQPIGLPYVGTSLLPEPVVSPAYNVGESTSTLTVENINIYNIYGSVLFTWTYPDGATTTGPSAVYTFPSYPNDNKLTLVASNATSASNTVEVVVNTIPDPSIPLPDLGATLSYQNIESETHIMLVLNTTVLSTYDDAKVHWLNLSDNSEVTGFSHTHTYLPFTNTTQYQVWTSVLLSGVRYESSRHTVTYTTVLHAILGPITKTLVSGTECETGKSAVLRIGNATSTTNDTVTYTAVAAAGITITPTTWSEGDAITVSVDYTQAHGALCEYTVTASDLVNDPLIKKFTNTITYVPTIDITNITKTKLSGTECVGNSSGTFNILGVTTTTGANITLTVSDVSANALITPTGWTQGSAITITLNGSASVGDTISYTVTATDGTSAASKIYTCTVSSVVALDVNGMSKTLLTGDNCVGNSSGTFNINGATTPTANNITYTSSNVTNGASLSPTTWGEADIVTITLDSSFNANDQVSFTVTTSDTVESVDRIFTCTVGNVLAMDASTMAKTIVSGSDCIGFASGIFVVDGADNNNAAAITYTATDLSAGLTISPTSWTEDEQITIAVGTVNIGDTLQFKVTAADGNASDNKLFTCTVSGLASVDVTDMVNVLVGGTGCVTDSSGTYRISGATNLNGPAITYTASNVTSGYTITPMSWTAPNTVVIAVPSTATIGSIFSYTITANDGNTTDSKVFSCTIAGAGSLLTAGTAIAERVPDFTGSDILLGKHIGRYQSTGGTPSGTQYVTSGLVSPTSSPIYVTSHSDSYVIITDGALLIPEVVYTDADEIYNYATEEDRDSLAIVVYSDGNYTHAQTMRTSLHGDYDESVEANRLNYITATGTPLFDVTQVATDSVTDITVDASKFDTVLFRPSADPENDPQLYFRINHAATTFPTGVSGDTLHHVITQPFQITCGAGAVAGTEFDLHYEVFNGCSHRHASSIAITVFTNNDMSTGNLTLTPVAEVDAGRYWVPNGVDFVINTSYSGTTPPAADVKVHITVTHGTVLTNDVIPVGTVSNKLVIRPDHTQPDGTLMGLTYEVIPSGGTSAGDFAVLEIDLRNSFGVKQVLGSINPQTDPAYLEAEAFGNGSFYVTGGPAGSTGFKDTTEFRDPLFQVSTPTTSSVGFVPYDVPVSVSVEDTHGVFNINITAMTDYATVHPSNTIMVRPVTVVKPQTILYNNFSAISVSGLPFGIVRGQTYVFTISGGTCDVYYSLGNTAVAVWHTHDAITNGWAEAGTSGCSSYHPGDLRRPEGETFCLKVKDDAPVGAVTFTAIIATRWEDSTGSKSFEHTIL